MAMAVVPSPRSLPGEDTFCSVRSRGQGAVCGGEYRRAQRGERCLPKFWGGGVFRSSDWAIHGFLAQLLYCTATLVTGVLRGKVTMTMELEFFGERRMCCGRL